MATSDFQYPHIEVIGGTKAVKNTSSSVAIAAGDCVTLDASNLASGTQPVDGVVQSANQDLILGIALENIAVGDIGRVMTDGEVQVVCSAAVTAGTMVMSSGSGQVATQTSAQPTVGEALGASTTGTGQLLRVRLRIAKNA